MGVEKLDEVWDDMEAVEQGLSWASRKKKASKKPNGEQIVQS
jgi:hypothetical protein